VSAGHTLERALTALPASHRRVVAANLGLAGATPAAITAALFDEARLDALIADLPSASRAAATELAFAGVDLWSSGSSPPAERAALDVLERRGLALCFSNRWSLGYVAPSDLVPLLRRVRARAHARRVPDAPVPSAVSATSEQLLVDVAAVGATITHGAIQIKADGDLYAKARPKLVDALGPLADGAPDFGDRVDLALALLQELGALRVVTDDIPGRNTRRVLEIDGDLSAALDLPFAERLHLARLLQRRYRDLQLIDPLFDELAGRTVAIEALGSAIIGLFAEACKHLSDDASPLIAGLSAVRLRVLSGGAAVGVDVGGNPATVTFAPPPPPPAADGHPCVAQADFELIALRPLLPHERATLYLLCEPVPGREHMARLTRERIGGAARALRERDPGGVLRRLRSLAGALPQNVERSVRDWVLETPPRARLRSAIVVDLGDGELGDIAAAKLGELVVERLAPNLLAVAAEELTAVASALRRAGIELDPGLDRVSGLWREPPTDDSRMWWRPSPAPNEYPSAPPGRLVSGLDSDLPPPAPPAGALGIFGRLAAAELELDYYAAADESDDDQPEPIEDLIDAYEDGYPVEVRYAAAEGTVVLRGPVARVEGVRFKMAGPGDASPRWRWLKGVLEVSEIDD
jgi:hypothetical protein